MSISEIPSDPDRFEQEPRVFRPGVSGAGAQSDRRGIPERKEACMGTIVTGLIVTAAAAAAVYRIIRQKKEGKHISCGGDCSRCGRSCR